MNCKYRCTCSFDDKENDTTLKWQIKNVLKYYTIQYI